MRLPSAHLQAVHVLGRSLLGGRARDIAPPHVTPRGPPSPGLLDRRGIGIRLGAHRLTLLGSPEAPRPRPHPRRNPATPCRSRVDGPREGNENTERATRL
jgi:hypothetical protein